MAISIYKVEVVAVPDLASLEVILNKYAANDYKLEFINTNPKDGSLLVTFRKVGQ